MDKRFIKFRFKVFLRSLLLGWFYTIIKKLSGKRVNKIISDVQKFGIAKIEDFFDENQILEIKKNYDQLIKDKKINERNQTQIEEEDFIKNKVLKENFMNEKIYKKLANIYLNGAPTRMSIGGKRIFTMKSKNFANYQWHHDGKIKSFKFYLLLTDMKTDGQKTEYLLKTHKLFNTMKNKVMVDDNPILKNFNKMEMVGKKGTCFFFDGNGIHRGNRNESYLRDTIIIEHQLI
jgi:hypothetical protein